MSQAGPVVPVILCGGSGTRLWPLSRKSFPKQFSRFLGEQSLFQGSALRLSGPMFDAPVVVTGSDYRFIVTEQLAEIGQNAQAILIEPEGRNTAPAILAAAIQLQATRPDALMLVAPSDHVIEDHAAFHRAVEAGLRPAQDGALVTFGITPTRPETGYGYLRLGAEQGAGVVALDGFVEKPDAKTASRMLEEGGYLWNAGIFLFSVRSILDAFDTHAPEMVKATRDSVALAKLDLDFMRLDPEAWARTDATSIDYAVMEKAKNLVAVPYSDGWSDLGDWQAVLREGERNSDGNALSGPALALDCEGSLLRSEADGLEVVGVGLKDMVVVAMPDAVLVADANRSQDVKTVVSQLKARGTAQAETLPRDYRPWGWFESLALGDKFQVKRIVVNPGGRLSLQSHTRRSEHWIVVGGEAKVTIDDTVRFVGENQSVYIPLGAKHRMENEGSEALILIEVQTGDYFGEDDITRYEDVYARD